MASGPSLDAELKPERLRQSGWPPASGAGMGRPNVPVLRRKVAGDPESCGDMFSELLGKQLDMRVRMAGLPE